MYPGIDVDNVNGDTGGSNLKSPEEHDIEEEEVPEEEVVDEEPAKYPAKYDENGELIVPTIPQPDDQTKDRLNSATTDEMLFDPPGDPQAPTVPSPDDPEAPPVASPGDPQEPIDAPPTDSDAPTPPSETQPVAQQPMNRKEIEQEAFKRSLEIAVC